MLLCGVCVCGLKVGEKYFVWIDLRFFLVRNFGEVLVKKGYVEVGGRVSCL